MTMLTFTALVVGALAGLHAATWGMYKDALYEGFSLAKYLRSVTTGALGALALQGILRFDLTHAAGLLLLFGTSYALERFVLESWKSFVRVEDQGKYFIPMAFAVGGRVVERRAHRLLAGLGYVAVVAAVIVGLAAMQPGAGRPPLALLLAVGTFGGWISAFGGAWKDAPKEGFQIVKFFRSPLIALSWALPLSALSGSYVVVAFGALGLTVATIETHKKFGRSREAPGKFAGKPVTHPGMYRLRRRAVPVYLAIWSLVAAALVVSMMDADLFSHARRLVELANG